MKKVSGLIRVLSGVIDVILVMIPVQFVMIGIFHVSGRQADLLFQLLFAVYGVLLVEYTDGRTVGKWFGRICTRDCSGTKAPILYMGLRELVKAMYFIPFIGWFLGLISLFMVFAGNGRLLHDYVGNTKVVYCWEKERRRDGDGI